MFKWIASALLCLAVFASTGCSAQTAGAAGATAWVEFVGGGRRVVRLVTPSSSCPLISVDGRPMPMSVRAASTDGFPNTVCQLEAPEGAHWADTGGRRLPLGSEQPRRIVVFGDTGCRLLGPAVQDCNDPTKWPFAELAAHAARHKPDLVVHVGDYYYRQTPCPAFRSGCAGSPAGDVWEAWDADFFKPAAPLLASAPWVFVRGNHESCGRGAQGWFRMLDSAPVPQTCPARSTPFLVTFPGLALAVLDSADASDRDPRADEARGFGAQLRVLKEAPPGSDIWLITHRPIWALVPIARLGPLGPLQVAINKTEQAAVADGDLGRVQIVLSGHIHHFASYSFDPSRPGQLIVGTGGDARERASTSKPRTGKAEIDGKTADALSFSQFGYLMLERTDGGWAGAFYDVTDRVIATCRIEGRSLRCVPRQ